MKIKVTKLASVTGQKSGWRLRFTAEIGEMEVKGEAVNFLRSAEQHRNLRNNQVYNNDFGIRLKFDNPGVRKHPDYQEIRQKVVIGILEKTKSKHSRFFAFGVGANLTKTPLQPDNSDTKQ